VPSSEFFEDMGRRTDVYFKNLLSDFKDEKTKVWYMDAKGPAGKRIEQHGWCVHASKEGCPFATVLYEGASENHRKKFKWDTRRKWALPYAYQTDDLHRVEHALSVFGPEQKVPSAGFKAFLTCAMLCDSIYLYGFAGTDALDGHFLAHSRHVLAEEHSFLDRASHGESLDADFVLRKMLDFGKPDPGLMTTMQRRLECLGGAGAIVVVKT